MFFFAVVLWMTFFAVFSVNGPRRLHLIDPPQIDSSGNNLESQEKEEDIGRDRRELERLYRAYRAQFHSLESPELEGPRQIRKNLLEPMHTRPSSPEERTPLLGRKRRFNFPTKVAFEEKPGGPEEGTSVTPLNSKYVMRDVREKGYEQILAIGDVHGALQELLDLLTTAKVIKLNNKWEQSGGKSPDWEWIVGNTIIVQIGDLFDRGLHNMETMDFFIELEKTAENFHNKVFLLRGKPRKKCMNTFFCEKKY